MKPVLIGFGNKARQGKDTAAQYIIEAYGSKYDVRRYAFGDQLKVEVYDTLVNGQDKYWETAPFNYLTLPHPPEAYESGYLTTTKISWCDTSDKVKWLDWHRQEVRPVLQHYGTTYRRGADQFYWVKALAKRLGAEKPQIALLTDIRFLTEFYWVRSLGGVCIRVKRGGFDDPTINKTHVSEVELDKAVFDYEIEVDDGDLNQLREDSLYVFQCVEKSLNPVEEIANEQAALSVAS